MMPLRPWRFQADFTIGETNPMVTVFAGPERRVMDANGDPTPETFVEQSTKDWIELPLSELPSLLVSGVVTHE